MGTTIRNATVSAAAIATVLVLAGIPVTASMQHGTDGDLMTCDLYGDPHGHHAADGHPHYHHTMPAATDHLHGDMLMSAGHTHPMDMHNPCNQTGMMRVGFDDASAFYAPPLTDVVIGAPLPDEGNPLGYTDVVLAHARETLRLDVPRVSVFDSIVIDGDAQLAAMGFPGSGTPDDPYEIAGQHVRGALVIRDTSSCIAVHDNVIHAGALVGPLVNPLDIVDLRTRLATLYGELQDAIAAVTASDAQLAESQANIDALRAQLETMREEARQKEAQRSALETAVTDATTSLTTARDDLAGIVNQIRQVKSDLDAHLAASNAPPAPEEPTPVGEPGDAAFATVFGAYVDAVEAYAQSVEDDGTHGGPTAADYAAQLATLQDAFDAQQTVVDALALARVGAIDARDVFMIEYTAFQSDYRDFEMNVWRPAKALHDALVADNRQLHLQLDAIGANAMDVAARLADHVFEYGGVGFDTLDEIAAYAVANANVPDDTVRAKLVLDWNGPCVHAYHNVIQDLRVNQNNHRVGYATGGLIEDNRIFHVGQIRHYDGEFRENEVGDRRYVEAFLEGSDLIARPDPVHADAYESGEPEGGPEEAPLLAGRVMNVDGFNQGSFHDNVFYGAVDLDYHGHHHGTGYFAPHSHYHGDDASISRMVNEDGTCEEAYEHDHSDPARMATDLWNDRVGIVTFSWGETCLPHHDHTQRWTTVAFAHNVVIDPLGYGLRYEDVDHAADDRYAASEAMSELNAPHVHRSHVKVEDNVVLGSVWVDRFNADGIPLWSDTYARASLSPTGRILDAALHVGAEIVDSHPERNAGWLDVQRNAVFVNGRDVAILVAEAKEMDRFALDDNRAYRLGVGFDTGDRAALAFAETLKIAALLDPADAAALVESWGGVRTTVGAGVTLATIRDSTIEVCGNAVYGFVDGLVAVSEIRPDATFEFCDDNVWNGETRVQKTPAPPTRAGHLRPAQELADGTPLASFVDAADYAVGYYLR